MPLLRVPAPDQPQPWLRCLLRPGSVQVSGEFRDYARQSDSGHALLQHFCPHCGSTVFWEPGRKPRMVAVAVGAFADPGFPAPAKQVHGETRHRWLTLPD